MLAPAPSLEDVLGNERIKECREKCRRKIAYRSRAAARNDVIVRNSRAHGLKAFKLRPYQCPTCGKWHLTSKV